MPVPRAARRRAIDSAASLSRHSEAPSASLRAVSPTAHRIWRHSCASLSVQPQRLRLQQHVPLDPACAGSSDPHTRIGSPPRTGMARTTAQTDQPLWLRVHVHSAGAAVCTLADACCGRISAPSRLNLNRAGSTVPTTPRRGAPAPLGAVSALLCSSLSA